MTSESEGLMRASVSQLTKRPQGHLQSAQYPPRMGSGKRDLTTPSDRIGWAIDQMKSRGIGLVELAARMECTHATLSQWQNGQTNIDNAKVGLLIRFAQETGVSMKWILTGEGARIDNYGSSERVAKLTQKLSAMERDDPDTLGVVAKMIDAAADPPATPGT